MSFKLLFFFVYFMLLSTFSCNADANTRLQDRKAKMPPNPQKTKPFRPINRDNTHKKLEEKDRQILWKGRKPKLSPVGLGSGPRDRNHDSSDEKEDSFIFWGDNAKHNHPYMASLQYYIDWEKREQHMLWDDELEQCSKSWLQEGPGWFHFCGGALIASDMVLTAAHCVDWLTDHFIEYYYDYFCADVGDYCDYDYYYSKETQKHNKQREKRSNHNDDQGDHNKNVDYCDWCADFYDYYDESFYSLDELRVGLGWWDLSKGEDAIGHQIFGVKSITIHPEWQLDWCGVNRTDVAILHLDRRADKTKYIQPIKVRGTGFSWKRGDCYLAGWGDTQCGVPNILQQTTAKVLRNVQCRRLWGIYGNVTHQEVPVYDSEICTLGWHHGPPTDTCYGDSGGVLVCDQKATGVVSWGDGHCQGCRPAVYAKLGYAKDWITEIVKEIRLKDKRSES